jgi:hypothetical protein
MEEMFSLFKFGRSSRLALAAGFFAIGALIQLIFPWGLLPGFLIIFLGYTGLFLKKITNKPADKGLEEWRPVTMKEVDRLQDTLAQSKKLRSKAVGGTVGRVLLVIFTLILAFISLMLDRRLFIIVADAFLFLVPAVFFGRVSFFVPRLLEQKIVCFQAIFSSAAKDGIPLTPYFRFDKDEEGRDIPEDMRIMMEPKRKPEDFIGIQFQAAINKGPNGEVPYLYAVFLTSGKGQSYEKLTGIGARGYHVEVGGDSAYGSIVVRQATSGTGYLTKPSDCERLYKVIMEMLRKAGLAS